MEKILVPTDFSETAGMAFDFALQLSARKNIPISLLHVFDFPVALEPNTIEELMKQSYNSAEESMSDFIEKYSKDDVSVVRIIESGSLTSIIERYRSHYDVIVMGTHGASGFKEIFMGSNAEKVIRRAKCPVYTIPNQQKIANLKHFIVPLQVEDLSEGFLHNLKELSYFFQAHLHFLYVDTPAGHINEEMFHQELDDILSHRNFHGYDIHTGRDFSAESGIFHFAENIGGNMICLSTHGKVGLAHFLEGSLAEDIANHSRIPVWTYNLKMEEHFEEMNNLSFAL